MKSLVDVRAALEAWIRTLDINTPADVVPQAGVVGNFVVDNKPHGGACDALAATTIKFYVSRAEEASAHEQADQLQTDIPDRMEAQRGGPWVSLRCLSSTVTEEVRGDATYVVVVFSIEVWV
jgi:hypothetical protein